uniref:DUF1338 domain-containing protein n=1 Tax=Macrostomum lignano TaxID=282301 RepID=A0A1I8F874_9PLAT
MMATNRTRMAKFWPSVQRLLTLFPADSFKPALPRIAFKHQLYSLCLRRACIDQELQQLRDSGRLRMFKIGGETDERFALMLSEEFEAFARTRQGRLPDVVFRRYLNLVLRETTDLSVTLGPNLPFSDTEISDLVQAGFLTVRDFGCYWVACPDMGRFVSRLPKDARQDSADCTPHQELETRLPQSSPPLEYMMHDLVGDGTLRPSIQPPACSIDCRSRPPPTLLAVLPVEEAGRHVVRSQHSPLFAATRQHRRRAAPSRMARTATAIATVAMATEVAALSNSSYEEFEAKLDAAAIEGVGVIIVEPALLGCTTARWIACGNFLHKSAVLSALGASCCAGLGAWGCGAAFAASSCAPLAPYELLWACDPVSWCGTKWRDLSQLRYTLALREAVRSLCHRAAPRRDTTRRRVLHCTAALIAA